MLRSFLVGFLLAPLLLIPASTFAAQISCLPDGTLASSPSTPNVFYVRNCKKSWVLPSILDRWLREAHFFDYSVVTEISNAELAKYPQVASVNPLYIGKVLRAPSGTQYYIDDKLRKRELSAPVRAKLKFPSGNMYDSSAAHLSEFLTGPKLDGKLQPGGMIIYDGAYHGGRIWRLEENKAGVITKRLYLADYFYEAEYYPDENQRVGVTAQELARYKRGANIEKYPDGWIVGLGSGIYVVQGQKLRHIGSPAIFSALGYTWNNVLRVYPNFLRKYAKGPAITAYKGAAATSKASLASSSGSTPAPSTSSHLTKVRPHVRSMINEINTLYIMAFDKDPTVSENKFWVDYVYNGEVNNRTDLIATMERAAQTGKRPSRTSLTARLTEDSLEQHWLPYLFYFVHQKEPSEDDKQYWYGRIKDGDRDSIEKLGGTLQWLKDTKGTTRN